MKTKARGSRRWFWRLCLTTVFAAIGIATVLLIGLEGSSMSELRNSVDAYHAPLTALRLGVIGLIALSWPRLIRYSEHKLYISIDRSIELAALRWRIIAWLSVIELLIGQNLLWWLFDTPGGSSG